MFEEGMAEEGRLIAEREREEREEEEKKGAPSSEECRCLCLTVFSPLLPYMWKHAPPSHTLTSFASPPSLQNFTPLPPLPLFTSFCLLLFSIASLLRGS
jgi:hypothetical protein